MTVGIDVKDLVADLAAEHEALEGVVVPLDDEHWRLMTPSPGWSVADQIGHLASFDDNATLAIEDPGSFRVERDALLQKVIGGEVSIDDATLSTYRAMTTSELLAAWRENRRRLIAAASTLDNDTRVEWYGPSMGAKSFLTARLMETWAHGQDVIDAVRDAGVDARREPTDRLRHIAQLGVITRGWSYKNRGAEVPAEEVRVELAAPSGDAWEWGPDDAADSVGGPAEDFCLVVTQRRHPHDTDLQVDGDAARDWMVHAQAFAGAATDGPAPKGG